MEAQHNQQNKEYIKARLETCLQDKGIDTGKPFTCLNPMHPDTHPSMSFDRKRNKAHCFSCGVDYDIYDIIGIDYGLTDYRDIFLKAEELFGESDAPPQSKGLRAWLGDDSVDSGQLTVDNEETASPSLEKRVPALGAGGCFDTPSDSFSETSAPPRGDKTPVATMAPPSFVKRVGDDEKTSPAITWNYPQAALTYLSRRGISEAVARRFGLRYDPAFPVKGGSWRALIVPTGPKSFMARNTDPHASKTNRVRKRGQVPLYLFNEAVKGIENEETSPNCQMSNVNCQLTYVVEGEFDALSVWEAGGRAFALGGIANISHVADRVRALYDSGTAVQNLSDARTNLNGRSVTLPTLYISLDNDKQGQRAADKLLQELLQNGIRAQKVNISGPYKDPNDALCADRESFANMVRNPFGVWVGLEHQPISEWGACSSTALRGQAAEVKADVAPTVQIASSTSPTLFDKEGGAIVATGVLSPRGGADVSENPSDGVSKHPPSADGTLFSKEGETSSSLSTLNSQLSTEQSESEIIAKLEQQAQAQQRQMYLQNSAAAHLESFLDGIAARVDTPAVSTGFLALDSALDGGLYEGLYIVGAISSLGKTTLMAQIMDNIACGAAAAGRAGQSPLRGKSVAGGDELAPAVQDYDGELPADWVAEREQTILFAREDVSGEPSIRFHPTDTIPAPADGAEPMLPTQDGPRKGCSVTLPDVLFFSLEMARSEIMAKSISRHTLELCLRRGYDTCNAKTARGITDGRRYDHYSERERTLIRDSVQEYAHYAPYVYIYQGVGDIGVQSVREIVQRHVECTGRAPVVIIDYIQILAPYSERMTDKQNTDKAVLELKRLSRDYKIPVIGISSFNRQNYREAVTMEAFKESGAIEYSADVLIGLQLKGAGSKDFDAMAEKRKNPREVELKVLKNRNGAAGESVRFCYYPLFNCFRQA